MFRRTQHTQTGQTFGTENVCIPFQLTDSLGGSRASSNSGLKKLGGPGAAPLNWTPGPIVELVDSSGARNGVSWRMNEKS